MPKRSVVDEPILIDKNFPEQTRQFLEQLYLNFTCRHWTYKIVNQLKIRDSALAAALTLSGVRANETQLKKKQVVNLEDRILLLNVKTQKRGYIRPKIVFPKTGMLAEFTKIFEQWLQMIPDNSEAYLFPHASSFGVSWNKPLSRYRVERLINLKTGNFPHWLRGVHETFYSEFIFGGNAYKLQKHMGLKRLESTKPYVQSVFEEDIEQNLFK